MSSSPNRSKSRSLRATSTSPLKVSGVRTKLHTAIPAKERNMATTPGSSASKTGREGAAGSMKEASAASPNSS